MNGENRHKFIVDVVKKAFLLWSRELKKGEESGLAYPSLLSLF
jgi:hypothetical protein